MTKSLCIFTGTVLLLTAMMGCDKVKELTAPAQSTEPAGEEKKPSISGQPELQILGISTEEQVALRDYLDIKGLMQQSADYVVVINTQLVRKGEILMMDVKKDSYRIEVESIDEERVILKASKED